MTVDPELADLSFPRLKARTRRFQLGRPRSFGICDGQVLFIRSGGPVDPVGSLWTIDPATGNERRVVDASSLTADDATLPAAERARRERLRETASGITGFSARAGRVAFAVGGVGYLASLDQGAPAAERIPVEGGIVDPRLSPDGSTVAFVVDGSVWTWRIGDDAATQQCAAEPDVTWGLADFAAAEELDRVRGHWWLPDGRLLVERVDESPVAIAWISDPEHPRAEPRPHRYPFAGTANARVSLWLIDPDGSRTELTWPAELEYLASVVVGEQAAVLQLLTRDQRRQVTMKLAVNATHLECIGERTDAAWIDVMGGVPRLGDDGALLDIAADVSTDTYRLTRDGTPVSTPGLQVHALLDEEPGAWVVLASPEPCSTHVIRIDRMTHEHHVVSDMHAWTSAVAKDGILVTSSSTWDDPAPRVLVHEGGSIHPVRSLAALPNIETRPRLLELGDRRLRGVLLLPKGHDGRPLPVICSPYGGPHHQRVVSANAAYAEDQWIADQGFAVLIVDGRGTGGRGPAWDRAICPDLAAVVLQDQCDALHAAAALEPSLDLTRVGIRGWSFGGYLAALAVLERPDVFHAAVAGAPVTDWRLYDTAYTERYLGLPEERPDAYEETDLIPRAATLERPLLILHGLADDNVLVAHALGLSSALLAAGRPHAFVPLSGVTHMTPQEVVSENLLRMEVEFFQRELTEAPAAPAS